jgi:hypothetical protein
MPFAEPAPACSQGLVLEGLNETGPCCIVTWCWRGSRPGGHTHTADTKNNGCSEKSYSKL